jgi:polysaccharide biosynthesis/export protein
MKIQRVAFVVITLLAGQGFVQAAPQSTSAEQSASGVAVPSDYVLGPDDVIGVVFWKDPDLSVDVTVRPDGKIALKLGKEISAAGLSPDQFRAAVVDEAKRYIDDPNVNIIVKQINSRKVYITGQVEKPAAYALTGPVTVMQLIALAGGLKEFAKAREIVIMRADPKGTVAYPFNYEEIIKGRRLEQNIVLRPGDTVVVP